MESETKQKKPPNNWYQPYKQNGIVTAVGLSVEFRDMKNGDVGRYMNQWINYTRILKTQTAFSAEEMVIAGDAIVESETLISKATGFTPQEIWDHAVSLRKPNQAVSHISSNGTK